MKKMDLVEIRKNIEGPSEDARYSGWMDLYNSTDPEAYEELNRIIGEVDPVPKILFTRFLSHVHTERSIQYLLEILQDRNSVVVDAAKSAFEKNHFSERYRKLIPLLFSSSVKAKYFAIEGVSKHGILEAIEPLIEMLEAPNEQLLLLLLNAFRFLPDRRIISIVSRYISHENELVRLKAMFVCGSLYAAGFRSVRKYLLSGLLDSSGRIRQAALWSLRKRPLKRDRSLFIRISSTDPDPIVRQEALEGLAFYPTKKVVFHLLKVLTMEKSRMVSLKAESLLIGMPVSRLIKGLRHVFRHQQERMRNRAILLFSEFQVESDEFLNYLLKELKKAKSDKERLIYLEALGVIKKMKALPVLEGYLKGSFVIAYTAMLSMLHIWSHHHQLPVLKYLQDPKLPAVIQQIILKTLIRKSAYWKEDEELIAYLYKLLDNENLNIRYLSAQALILTGKETAIDPLFELLLYKESDPTSTKLLRENIVELLGRNPGLLVQVMRRYHDNLEALKLLCSVLGTANLSQDQLFSMIPSIFEEPLDFFISGFKEVLMHLFAVLIQQGKLPIKFVLLELDKVAEKDILLELLVKETHQTFPYALEFPIQIIRKWFQEDNKVQREAVIDLMGYSGHRAAIPILVSLICDDSLLGYHQKASKALNRLL